MSLPEDDKPFTELLDDALEQSFPASDPPSMTAKLTATASESVLPASEHCGNVAGTVSLYRVISEDQVDKPFSNGGSYDGGRWTSPGTPGVYASLSSATALLEYLAHAKEKGVSQRLFMARAVIPRSSLMTQVVFPSTWRERPYRDDVRQVGDDWARNHRSLALQVPSAICDDACNVVLNPDHVDFPLLQSVTVEPLELDDRLCP